MDFFVLPKSYNLSSKSPTIPFWEAKILIEASLACNSEMTPYAEEFITDVTPPDCA